LQLIYTLSDAHDQPFLINLVKYMRFYVLTAASVKMGVFWDVAPCSLLEIHQVLEVLTASKGSHLYEVRFCYKVGVPDERHGPQLNWTGTF
jgi:hypothetical protein